VSSTGRVGVLVWDGSRSHRSRLIWDFMRQQRGRLWLEFLPAYAPELNPVEYLWSHWKKHELPNFCPDSYDELSDQAPSSAASNAPPAHTGLRLLATDGAISIVTILC
jgi:transposase